MQSQSVAAKAQFECAEIPASKVNMCLIRTGDIIFVHSRSKRARDRLTRFVNINGQRILAAVRKHERISMRVSAPKYSHVMLGLERGIVIHADGRTVNIEVLSDILHHYPEGTFSIYRRRNMSPDFSEKLAVAAMKYYNQDYGFASYFTNSSRKRIRGPLGKQAHPQFCSQLVAHAYRAAGIPLTLRSDNRILPIDLYRLCQSDEWRNISSEFMQLPITTSFDNAAEAFGVLGKEKMTLSSFMHGLDDQIIQNAKLKTQMYRVEYSVLQNLMDMERTYTKICSLYFEQAIKIRNTPNTIEDTQAGLIAQVLRQINLILSFSLLQNIDQFTEEHVLDLSDQAFTDRYIEFPSSAVIKEIQNQRRLLTVFTYLTLAEVGLLAILSHSTSHKKLQAFRTIKREYRHLFMEAMAPIENLSIYDGGKDLFPWIESETLRAEFKVPFTNIIAALKGINDRLT